MNYYELCIFFILKLPFLKSSGKLFAEGNFDIQLMEV